MLPNHLWCDIEGCKSKKTLLNIHIIVIIVLEEVIVL